MVQGDPEGTSARKYRENPKKAWIRGLLCIVGALASIFVLVFFTPDDVIMSAFLVFLAVWALSAFGTVVWGWYKVTRKEKPSGNVH